MRGSYSYWYKPYVITDLVCPPCGGVIPAYHYLLLTINQFVPRAGELFCYASIWVIRRVSLSPVWGVILMIFQSALIICCLSPVRESYSLYPSLNCFKYSLSPVRGSYSTVEQLLRRIQPVCPPYGGVIPSHDHLKVLHQSFIPPCGGVILC